MTGGNIESTQSTNSPSPTSSPMPSILQDSATCDKDTQPSLPEHSSATQRKPRPLKSEVWNHFKKIKIGSIEKAECLHCGQQLSTASKNGTSHLKDHIKVRCSKKDVTVSVHQQLLNYSLRLDGTARVENHNFSQDVTRKELANMVILHEYPLSIVDHIGFKRYSASLNPNFKLITRPTLRSDIVKMFVSEKAMLRKFFEKHVGRISITTDMWTATHQKKGYMAVTSHFIDHQWNLQNKTLRFAYVPCPHTSKVIAEVILETLEMYNIHEKVSSVVVDNCTTNDKMIQEFQKRFDTSTLLLNGAFLHLRYSAHILNLIVQDGLDVIGKGIEKIRDCVSFWSASPKRVQMFEDKAKILKVYCSKKLILDCKTRWNSIYFMLQTAFPYKDIFSKLKLQHSRFKFDVPSDDEWKWSANICEKLSKFHKVTEVFSGRKYPTSNLYFRKVCELKISLTSWLSSDDIIVKNMAIKMMEKFDKYWSSINGILAIAAVLDPRDKLKCVEWYFNKIYGAMTFDEIDKVKNLLYDLLYEYQDSNDDDIECEEYISPPSTVLGKRCVDSHDDEYDFGKAKKSRKKTVINVRSELDYYLEVGILPDSKDFNILNYWKTDLKCPTLRKIAKDILAIPVSTVASESAFSMGGRVVSPHRSRLHADTVEALMCMQNWMRAEFAGSLVDIETAHTILDDVDVEGSADHSSEITKVVEVDRYLNY